MLFDKEKFVIALIILFLCKTEYINADLFTSLEHMTRLVKTEVGVTGYLRGFLQKQLEVFKQAEAIVNDFEYIATNSDSDPVNFVGNPVNSFLLIKKLTKDLQKFVDVVNTLEPLKKMVADIKENFILPSNDDYVGAISALHRLEDTYLLEPEKISHGNLSQKHPSRALNGFECFELGRIAYDKEDFYHAVRWFMVALDRAEIETENPTVEIIDVLDYLAFSTAQVNIKDDKKGNLKNIMQIFNLKLGNLKHALDLTERMLKLDPTHQRSKANLDFYKRALKERARKIRGDDGSDEASLTNNPFEFKNPRPPNVLGYERDSYEALCRNEPVKPISQKRLKNLKCRYINYHPLLKIAPVKEELVFDNPAIWIYHDVITDGQIDIMKTLAFPKLKRAIVRSPITGNFETADYRISQSGWLTDREHPALAYLTKLVSAVTNLTMETAEEWQIANYGLGGQYEPHFDFARKRDPGDAFDYAIGNRIATWLFYLEVPEVGGSTVFPRVGVNVKPIRRSAAFWYNLLPSGDGDFKTRHAACPVLFGSKWVSNKWIHLVGQEKSRPCNLVREPTEDIE